MFYVKCLLDWEKHIMHILSYLENKKKYQQILPLIKGILTSILAITSSTFFHKTFNIWDGILGMKMNRLF